MPGELDLRARADILEHEHPSPGGIALSGAKPTRRIVQPRPEGGWEVVKPHHERASAVTRTQQEAQQRARQIVSNLGGGEMTTKGRDNKFRDSDTVPHGNDPFPPKDKE